MIFFFLAVILFNFLAWTYAQQELKKITKKFEETKFWLEKLYERTKELSQRQTHK